MGSSDPFFSFPAGGEDTMKGRILVHGGAGPWEEVGRLGGKGSRGLREAVEAGLAAMGSGSAVDAVVEAVASLEGSGAFNAGKGAVLNLAGRIELDAGVMDGERTGSGAVAAVRSVPHPVRLARVVMERTGHMLLVGDGAEELARVSGLSGEVRALKRRTWEYEHEKAAWLKSRSHRWVGDLGPPFVEPREGDTVGAVAMDGEGRFAAAASTGGPPFKLPGRVGDSPLVGHGYYALRGAGAASTSGIGEAIARYGLSLRAVLRTGDGAPAQEAAEQAIAGLTDLFGENTAGVILLDRTGSPGVFFNTGGMAVGYGRSRADIVSRIVKREQIGEFSLLMNSRGKWG
jgi:beta-aspartyl-peptidase (threonine type)